MSRWRDALKSRLQWLLPLWVVLVALAIYLASPLLLQGAQNMVFDQFQRWHPRQEVANPVPIIDIDDESLRRLGQWPWPRTRLAELTDKLRRAGVTAIGFDMVFAEPDRTSPKAMADLWKPPADLQQMMAQLPDHDQVFAQELRQGRVVLGVALNRQPQAGQIQAASQARFVALGEPALPWVPAFVSSVANLPTVLCGGCPPWCARAMP